MAKTLELDISEINRSLLKVENNWDDINDLLEKFHIGRKEVFDSELRERMISAYEFVNQLLEKGTEPFSNESILLELNHLVHYGRDSSLRREYKTSLQAAKEKFDKHIPVIRQWYREHEKHDSHPLKIAAEIYVGIVGPPQLFIEGNHRTGSVISSWIDLYNGYPPFILSPDNAIAYFEPSSEIKSFTNKSTWRGRNQLPKYKKSFREFWEKYIDKKYIKDN
jgi:hypothetical protein